MQERQTNIFDFEKYEVKHSIIPANPDGYKNHVDISAI